MNPHKKYLFVNSSLKTKMESQYHARSRNDVWPRISSSGSCSGIASAKECSRRTSAMPGPASIAHSSTTTALSWSLLRWPTNCSARWIQFTSIMWNSMFWRKKESSRLKNLWKGSSQWQTTLGRSSVLYAWSSGCTPWKLTRDSTTCLWLTTCSKIVSTSGWSSLIICSKKRADGLTWNLTLKSIGMISRKN